MCDDLDDDLLASRVPLQRMTLALPTDAGFANVQFVLRSADQSMWLRDGEGNFQVPLPRTPFTPSVYLVCFISST